MRINKYIASNSQYSRRKADELIVNGKVFLNGERVTKLGTDVDFRKDKITIGGEKIKAKKDFIYLALNKPKGYISTRKDDLNRKTVMDLVPKIKNLKPVGRLDKDSEGLLLFSNDGNFINKLTHPKYECQKVYLVELKEKLSDENKEKLEKGIKISGKRTSPATITIKSRSENKTTLIIKIYEGRNRQIRKMFAYFEHPVKYLQRISIGKIQLGSLARGSYRKLTQSEINAH